MGACGAKLFVRVPGERPLRGWRPVPRRIAEVDWPGIRVPRDRAAVRDEHGHRERGVPRASIAAGIGAGAVVPVAAKNASALLRSWHYAGDGHVVEAHRMPCRGIGPARASFVAAAEIEVDLRSVRRQCRRLFRSGRDWHRRRSCLLNARVGSTHAAAGDGFVGRGLADRAGDRLDGHRAIGRGGIRRVLLGVGGCGADHQDEGRRDLQGAS